MKSREAPAIRGNIPNNPRHNPGLAPAGPAFKETETMTYKAPIKDMLFDMEHLAQIEQVAQIPGFEDAGWKPRRPCSKNAPSSAKAWSLP
jgi:hypothetical protein